MTFLEQVIYELVRKSESLVFNIRGEKCPFPLYAAKHGHTHPGKHEHISEFSVAHVMATPGKRPNKGPTHRSSKQRLQF
jgi:hypothetical protein